MFKYLHFFKQLKTWYSILCLFQNNNLIIKISFLIINNNKITYSISEIELVLFFS